MTQDKRGITATKLHRYLGISYNAAWRMRRKVMRSMLERDGESLPIGWGDADDAVPHGHQSTDRLDRGTTSTPSDVLAV